MAASTVFLGKVVRIFLSLVLLTGCIVGVIYLGKYLFRIRDITFVGEGMKVVVDESLFSGNLLFFPSNILKKSILSEYPELKDVIVRRRFPSTLEITLVKRLPFAVLLTSKTWYQVDEEGIVVGVGWESAMPTITVDIENVRTGRKIDDARVTSSLSFLTRVKNIIPVSSIETSSDGTSLIAKAEQTNIFFSQNNDIAKLTATLQTIITSVRIKGTMPKVIDMRYSNPVIQW